MRGLPSPASVGHANRRSTISAARAPVDPRRRALVQAAAERGWWIAAHLGLLYASGSGSRRRTPSGPCGSRSWPTPATAKPAPRPSSRKRSCRPSSSPSSAARWRSSRRRCAAGRRPGPGTSVVAEKSSAGSATTRAAPTGRRRATVLAVSAYCDQGWRPPVARSRHRLPALRLQPMNGPALKRGADAWTSTCPSPRCR
jgi:hypothetical protein